MPLYFFDIADGDKQRRDDEGAWTSQTTRRPGTPG
jgi:hypothetical protein